MEQEPKIGGEVESVERPVARIDLHFFRHDEKESDKTKSDTEIRLTPAGKKHAKSLASPETNLAQSVAFGSPRKRTQETAGLVMAGAEDEITGEESLDELKGKLNEGIDYGSKLNSDPRLDFILPSEGKYLEEGLKAFKEGRLLKWLVEESDAKFREHDVEEGYFSYSNQASQIAQIIEKYLKILPRWQELVEDESKSYKPELERFFGTHQTVSESFLAKVIELTKGVEERDRFVQSLGNSGFGYADGYEVTLEGSGYDDVKIRVKYIGKSKGDDGAFEFDEVIDQEVLAEMLEGSEDAVLERL